jgi:hypothetical protein
LGRYEAEGADVTDEEIRRYLDRRDAQLGPDVASAETEFMKALYERVVALERATVPLVAETSSTLSIPAPERPKHFLAFIVNGEEAIYQVTPGMLIRHARNAVLEQLGYTGRPPDEYEVRDVYGNLVSPDAIAVSFAQDQRLFCTLAIAAGGAS